MRKRRRSTPEFKAELVLEILSGARSPAEACRKHALSPNRFGLWKATFLERAHTLFQPDEQRDETRPASPSWSNCWAGRRARSRFSKSLEAAGCGLDQQRAMINNHQG